MIRLPEEFRAQLARHKQKTRVPMTAAVQIALEEFLAKHGLWPPEAGDDDKPAARRKN